MRIQKTIELDVELDVDFEYVGTIHGTDYGSLDESYAPEPAEIKLYTVSIDGVDILPAIGLETKNEIIEACFSAMEQ